MFIVEKILCYMGHVYRAGKERVTWQEYLFKQIETWLADVVKTSLQCP